MTRSAPIVQQYSLQPPEGGIVEVEFRLVYTGPLQAQSHSNARLDVKHAIRKQLHLQLKELWVQHRQFLTEQNEEYFASIFERSGFRFVPLINRKQGKSCTLDILFLRRDSPGNLVESGGDLDNRIKVLFDALRMARDRDELPKNAQPEQGEDPFHCLLEDDSLITSVNITTDRLLTPLRPDEHIHEVVLIIKVESIIPTPEWHVIY